MTTQINFVIVTVIFIVSFSYSEEQSSSTSESLNCTWKNEGSNETSSNKCGQGNEENNSIYVPKCTESAINTESKICDSTKNDEADLCNDTRVCLVALPYCNIKAQRTLKIAAKNGISRHWLCHCKNREPYLPGCGYNILRSANTHSSPTTPFSMTTPSTTMTASTTKMNDLKKSQNCSLKCDTQGNVMIFNITQLENTSYCWIVIPKRNDSACNLTENKYWKFVLEYKYPIGGTAIGIIALVMVVCICCIVRRKKKPMSPAENIPLQSKYPEYMEDNLIYS